MPTIEIHPPEITKEDGWIRAAYAVRGMGAGDPTHLTFEVPDAYHSFVDASCDAAVVALLPLAMNQGKDIEVCGPLSAILEWRLRHTAVPVLMRLVPGLLSVSVKADELVTRRETPDGAVIAGLSCGVDSLVACQDFLLDPGLADTDRITHFLFTEIGSHGDGPEATTFIEPRWQHVSKAAAAMDRPIIRVRSNMGQFYHPYPDLSFEQTMTPRAASVALFLQKGVRRYLLASGQPWEEVKVDPWTGTGPVDPILMAAFSTACCEQTVVGLDYTRAQKTEIVSRMVVARQFLNVCTVQGNSNCGYCKKCLRTALTLEIFGSLQHFSGVFDLDAYGRNRTQYIGEILGGGGLYIPEIRELMAKQGFEVPAASRIDRRARQIWEWVPELGRKMIRPFAGIFRR